MIDEMMHVKPRNPYFMFNVCPVIHYRKRKWFRLPMLSIVHLYSFIEMFIFYLNNNCFFKNLRKYLVFFFSFVCPILFIRVFNVKNFILFTWEKEGKRWRRMKKFVMLLNMVCIKLKTMSCNVTSFSNGELPAIH